MSTIKGIFEPFYNFVTTQLNLRKSIIGEGRDFLGNEENDDYQPETAAAGASFTEGGSGDEVEGTRTLGNTLTSEAKVSGGKKSRSKNFFAYTTQKQCTIRMASGVDVREENNLLDEYETHLIGPELSRNWVLEGGVKGFSGQRSGFSEGNSFNMSGEAYGDYSTRSDAGDGFGIVPMPGIVDATIDTKSDNGSLREAKVNFVCHNRRQLEVLEALYMRPGYPILLEWGWVPYISNDLTIENDNPSILDEFMDAGENLNSLNFRIQKNKINTGGNYDGFIGFCKNFEFKVREDGGYDCVTEIIAHGEILESLKTPITIAPRILTAADALEIKEAIKNQTPREYESIDRFLFYLRAIKTNLDAAGTQASLNYMQTMREETIKVRFTNNINDKHNSPLPPTPINYGTSEDPRYLFEQNEEEAKRMEILLESSLTLDDESSILKKVEETSGLISVDMTGFKDENDEFIPIHILNQIDPEYGEGYKAVKKLVHDVSKVSIPELDKQEFSWKDGIHFLDSEEARSGSVKKNWLGYVTDSKKKNHIKKSSILARKLFTAGLDPILEGTILKELSVEDENENDSGIRKKIFVRWDLICQLLNKKVTPQYKEDHALVELTYLNPNQPTFKKGENLEGHKDWSPSHKKWKGDNSYYLDYSTNSITYQQIESSEDVEEQDSTITQLTQDDTLSTLGQSFDRNVCLMPHQIDAMKKSQGKSNKYNVKEVDDFTINPLTSFSNTTSTDHSIGMVYFNLDYLISTYEELALETFKTDANGVEKTKKRIKNKFSFHDWITTIWDGVNDACGGYYNFGLHTEHSRPHVARVIDFTFSGGVNDLERPIFQFNPQGLESISRESSYVSKIDNDFASVISIAAQSPINIHSLEAMSFKAFHKNVKNRFTTIQDEQETIDAFHTDMEKTYKADVKRYNDALLSLNFFVSRMNQSNYETDLINLKDNPHYKKPMSPSTAKDMASRLEEMKHSIDSRYGEKENDIVHNNSKGESQKGIPWVGTFREGTTFNRSAIIPITVSMTIDGIGGIHPLQIFKINSEKLPLGYQNEDIVFVVKKEAQSITSTQDWTTKLEGYLTLLNNNPNLSENSSEYINSDTDDKKEKLDKAAETPNADKLRSDIKQLSSLENPNLTFIIKEKIGTSTITDSDPQLSSGGDIDPLLVEKTMSIFTSIKMKLKNYLSVKIRITAGNDLYHQQKHPDSKHTVGKALDFTIDPYNPQTKAAVEEALTEYSLYFDNDYENTNVDDHFHFQV